MERYNYLDAVVEDVIWYIGNNDISIKDIDVDELHDTLFVEDSVTGNASGSYTFNTWQAEENLAHNWDLIEECAEGFGIEPIVGDGYKNGPEYWDVSIRCYLLGQAIDIALEKLSKGE